MAMMKQTITLLTGLLILAAQQGMAQKRDGGGIVQPVDAYIRSAKIALATNPPEYDRALRNLHTARDNYPESFQVHFLLGAIWADKDEIDSMIIEFDLTRKYAPPKEWEKIVKSIDKIKDSKWVERFNRAVSLISLSDSTEEMSAWGQAYSDSLKNIAGKIRAMAKEALRHCTLLEPGRNVDSSLASAVIAGAKVKDEAFASRIPEKRTAAAVANQEPKDCMKIETFDSSVLSTNDVFTELAWKVDVANPCSEARSVRVRFAIYDKDDFELDSDEEDIYVPPNGIGKARGKMLVSPPEKARRMARQGASISAR